MGMGILGPNGIIEGGTIDPLKMFTATMSPMMKFALTGEFDPIEMSIWLQQEQK